MITQKDMQMTTNVCFNDALVKHAQIQGASSPRLRVATVVKSLPQVTHVVGAPITDGGYGGLGSRAWSPPV